MLGSPISHSKSPVIQRAAFEVLGLDWSYGAVEMTGDGLASFIEGLDDTWRGLSLTMPLKRDVIPLLARRHELRIKVDLRSLRRPVKIVKRRRPQTGRPASGSSSSAPSQRSEQSTDSAP